LITREEHVGQEGKRKNFSLQASSFSRLGMQVWTSQNSILFSDLGKQGFGAWTINGINRKIGFEIKCSND
jgi:hypothetical protein